MTAFANIVAAIAPFGYPYQPDIYEGKCEKYFVYNYAAEGRPFLQMMNQKASSQACRCISTFRQKKTF